MNISDSLSTSSRSLVLLAPANRPVDGNFRRVSHNYSLYNSFKQEMQHLRGRLYLKDGAISAADIGPDGRHELATDDRSWHLLTIDQHGSVAGCTRYLQHSENSRFSALTVKEAALARCRTWGRSLRFSVESEMRTARAQRFSYVEIGGWAMHPSVRGTAECLRSVLATYAWSRLIGGALGISTATERNGSSTILQKLGGKPLEWDGISLPPYFDPHYNCRMHMLRFDSRRPNPRYENVIEQIREMLTGILVVSPETPAARSFPTDGLPHSMPLSVPSHSPSHSMVHAA